MVGGGGLTRHYAEMINAMYAKDAMESVRIAKSFLKKIVRYSP
jgi:methanogenic corrinoid protein MtbC1